MLIIKSWNKVGILSITDWNGIRQGCEGDGRVIEWYWVLDGMSRIMSTHLWTKCFLSQTVLKFLYFSIRILLYLQKQKHRHQNHYILMWKRKTRKTCLSNLRICNMIEDQIPLRKWHVYDFGLLFMHILWILIFIWKVDFEILSLPFIILRINV